MKLTVKSISSLVLLTLGGLIIVGLLLDLRRSANVLDLESYSNNNSQLINERRLHRSGKTIYMTGTVFSKDPPYLGRPEAYAVITPSGDAGPNFVWLTGQPAAICTGDHVALHGTYTYSEDGGSFDVDRMAFEVTTVGAGKLGRAMRGLFPSFCGLR